MHRYLAEFDFRHNNRAALDINDEQRAVNMIKGVTGKRLKYRHPNTEVTNGDHTQDDIPF